MNIKSILVATDLSVQENAAVQRAWQLADAHRASVKLMYMPPRGKEVPASAASRLANVARQLEESLELRVRTTPVGAHKLEDLVAEARGVDLVVLPHRSERSTAAFFRGQPLLRILRGSSTPVLVTRHAGDARYQRILVAVDLSRNSSSLVKLAADLEPLADLELFHVIDTLDEARLRAAEATEQAVTAYREGTRKRARQRMLALTESFRPRRNSLSSAIGRGDPGRQIVLQQQHSGAHLVVVGKADSSAWGDFLCGSVAHRILSWGSGDVLVVPQAYWQAAAPAAACRMERQRA
jgi:nucleotide-binding universal stress UspA family protein